jgi:phosphosulfolactate phosphohydrolase-like enzyme
MVIAMASRIGCLALIGSFALATSAFAEQVAREQDIVNLRLGQRILVDDGSCPAGQIKQVLGAQMKADGVVRVSQCIARLGTKK